MLRKERELEDARLKLAALRRAKYGEGGDSEGDGYLSGYDSSTRWVHGLRAGTRRRANSRGVGMGPGRFAPSPSRQNRYILLGAEP